MIDRPAFITDYIAAYLAANPGHPEPEFEGPNARGWYSVIAGTEPAFVTRVSPAGLIEMTARLRARVEAAL